MNNKLRLSALFVLSFLCTQNAHALEWKLNLGLHSDYSFSQGYHGCGTLMGKFEEKGKNPVAIADKYCKFMDTGLAAPAPFKRISV